MVLGQLKIHMGKNKSPHTIHKSIPNARPKCKSKTSFQKTGEYTGNRGVSKSFLNMSQKYKGRD